MKSLANKPSPNLQLQEDPAFAVQARTLFLPYFAAALSSSLDLPNPQGFLYPPSSERFNELRNVDGSDPSRSFEYFPQAPNDPWKPPAARNAFGPANPFVPSKHSSRLPGGGSFFRGGSPSVLAVTRSSSGGQFRDRPNPSIISRPPLLPFTAPPQTARSTWGACDGEERNASLPLPAANSGSFFQRLLENPGQGRSVLATASSGTPQLDLNAPSQSIEWLSDLGQTLEGSYNGLGGRAGSEGQSLEGSYGGLRGQAGSEGQTLQGSYGGLQSRSGFEGQTLGGYGAFQPRSGPDRPRDALARLAETVAEIQQRGSEFGVGLSPSVSKRASDLLGRFESRDQGANLWQGTHLESQTRCGDEMGPADFQERLRGLGAVARIQAGAETAQDWGSREEAFRLQESFLRLQEQLEKGTIERRPFLSLGPGNGRQATALEHDGLLRVLKGEAAAQEVRFSWTPANADESGRHRESPVQQSGRPEGGFGYEEIYTPRAQAERGAQEDSSGGERSLLSHSHSSRESEGGAEKTRGAGIPFAGGLGKAWNSDQATPSKRQAEMETIFENEPAALRPWEKGRQTWYSNLEHLRSLVPNTSQVRYCDTWIFAEVNSRRDELRSVVGDPIFLSIWLSFCRSNTTSSSRASAISVTFTHEYFATLC